MSLANGLMLIAASIAALGLFAMCTRRTFFGVLLAVQICILSAGMILVLSGLRSGAHTEGDLSAAFIVLAGLGQLSAGLGLAAKMYLGRANLNLDELRTLKR